MQVQTIKLPPPTEGRGRVGEGGNPWSQRAERAAELAKRYPHAAEMLRLYQALIPVQERAFLEARSASLAVDDVAAWAVTNVMPSVIDATVSAGPAMLRDGVVKVFCSADLGTVVRRWLEDESLDPFERYLARASASPVLEASKFPSPRLQGEGQGEGPSTKCPACGGLPQLSYFALSGEELVTGPRYLLCSRCANSWVYSRMMCANCGESTGARLPIYQEQEQFPHVRVDGCRSCKRYLLTFDLRRDARAVPIVDELAALPLDLYAIDRGLTKITPNLLGN